MTSSFNYTAAQVAEVAIALANDSFRLASVVTRYGENEFRPGRGDTVYLSVPGALTAHARLLDDVTNAIILDSLTESQEPVKLGTHCYSAVPLSEADMSLNITDFGKQVLAPQSDAVVDKVESAIENVLSAVTPTTATYDPTAPVKVFTAGRAELRSRGIDLAAADLVALVGANVVDDLLESGELDFQKTGSPDALRNGSLGRIRGFETIETGRVGDDEVILFPRSALYLAHRAPVVPEGASFGQTLNRDGFSLRYLRDYDPIHTVDRSVVSTFVGAGVLPLYRVERTQDTGTQGDAGFTAGSATVTEVPGGAVVKIDTAAA